MWILFAFGSALFAGLTSILAKCGIRETDSTVATACTEAKKGVHHAARCSGVYTAAVSDHIRAQKPQDGGRHGARHPAGHGAGTPGAVHHRHHRGHVRHPVKLVLSVCPLRHHQLRRHDRSVSGLRWADGLPRPAGKGGLHAPAHAAAGVAFIGGHVCGRVPQRADGDHLPAGCKRQKPHPPRASGGADQHHGLLPVRHGAVHQLDGLQRGADLRFRVGLR